VRAYNEVMVIVHRDRWIIAGAVAAPFAAAAALIPLRDRLDNTNIALLLVITVVAAAASGRRSAAVLSALSAAAGFNVFHTQPYLSLRIESSDDLETAVLLLVVGLIVGELAVRGRRARATVAQDRHDLAALHDVGALVATGEDPDYVLMATASELTHLLGLLDCRYESTTHASKVLPVIDRDGGVMWGPTPWDARQWGLPSDGAAIDVWSHGARRGRFVLHAPLSVPFSRDQLARAAALVDLAGASLSPSGAS
jgi:K+-sensing histidine kinase KdpD